MARRNDVGMNTDQLADATPTKPLFISTLTRDIGLDESVLDLVDNCIDGAKRWGATKDFSEFWIDITVNGDQFTVDDNCGGIPFDLAKNYAFKFGRDSSEGHVPHSVGRFGVGMKRTLFKLANEFEIVSTHTSSYFELAVDVDAWQESKPWNFKFRHVDETGKFKDEEVGTTISVLRMRPEVRRHYSAVNNQNELREKLRSAYLQVMQMGLMIYFNGELLEPEPLQLLFSKAIRPCKRIATREVQDQVVSLIVLAGVGENDARHSGWHVFFNDRLLKGADQSNESGWGVASLNMPKYHRQYQRFRGYVYLDCDDAGVLPWDTTKTGFSMDSEVYEWMLGEMAKAGRQVIDFLNLVKKESDLSKKASNPQTPLLDSLTNATSLDLMTVRRKRLNPVFVWPKDKAPQPRPKKTVRIAYDVDIKRFEAAKMSLEASTQRDVGRLTFDYYYAVEVEG